MCIYERKYIYVNVLVYTYVCVSLCVGCVGGEEQGSGSRFSVVVASMIYVLLCIRYKISVVSIYFTVRGA